MKLHPITDAFKCSRMFPKQEEAVGRIMAALVRAVSPPPKALATPQSQRKGAAIRSAAREQRTEAIMAYISEHPGQTHSQIAEAMSLTQSMIADTCQTLRAQGRIVTSVKCKGSARYTLVFAAQTGSDEQPRQRLQDGLLRRVTLAGMSDTPAAQSPSAGQFGGAAG